MPLSDSVAPPSWQAFFDSHAPHYDENVFTKWTTTEVSFLVDLLSIKPGASILDIGCGTGRHAIEFAKRGFDVVGVDLSEGMLAVATQKAAEANVSPEFFQANAVDFRTERRFDAVLCLCEGGLNLVDPGSEPIRHDLGILTTAFQHLKPGGRFVTTVLNGYQTIRQMTDELVQGGAFDPATMISQYRDNWKLPEGEREISIRERLYIPPEFVAMLRHVGFEVEYVWGGTAGEWGRRPLKLDEIEAMYVAKKP